METNIFYVTIMPDLSRAKHGEAVVPDYHRFRVDLAKEMGKERYKSLSEGYLVTALSA